MKLLLQNKNYTPSKLYIYYGGETVVEGIEGIRMKQEQNDKSTEQIEEKVNNIRTNIQEKILQEKETRPYYETDSPTHYC